MGKRVQTFDWYCIFDHLSIYCICLYYLSYLSIYLSINLIYLGSVMLDYVCVSCQAL